MLRHKLSPDPITTHTENMTTKKNQHQEPKQLPNIGFVRTKTLLQFVPFSASTLSRKVKSGDFPAPVKLSEGISAFKVEEVREWIESKQQGVA
ncbi:helix-turn-helix transcriptional regulator [methanotrophic endosymbiont of Bathymodiolus puteoserpentis (Logatchev)]|uniref:helix-turn-helix transcriptional regulator n=1 Tax=methanotrophic endosymbiont of Bathymodiolus puteoserpentis (Logatchev) TaxID=343235 RepID=UPI001FD97735|nr:AlpA family phage regulatory protein [methanotrophic endosymbiont of Bathymodiolus puteoserpentis (Logatchev)]